MQSAVSCALGLLLFLIIVAMLWPRSSDSDCGCGCGKSKKHCSGWSGECFKKRKALIAKAKQREAFVRRRRVMGSVRRGKNGKIERFTRNGGRVAMGIVRRGKNGKIERFTRESGRVAMGDACVPIAMGCTDPDAVKYDNAANTDNGSCYYDPGCTDPSASNYDDTADFDDGSCQYHGAID